MNTGRAGLFALAAPNKASTRGRSKNVIRVAGVIIIIIR